MSRFIRYIIASTLLVTQSQVLAQMPPKEAIHACSGLLREDRCQFERPSGFFRGVCRIPPGQTIQACISIHPKKKTTRKHLRKKRHSVVQSSGMGKIYRSTKKPITDSYFHQVIEGDKRILRGNGIPSHNTGAFPNAINPNGIKAQTYHFTVPAQPKIKQRSIMVKGYYFGVAINSTLFDPTTDEWFMGKAGSDWQYEALSGFIPLGIDQGNAHVHRGGIYHYHGVPKLLLKRLSLKKSKHSPLIGWAADGFPIYAIYGFSQPLNADSEIVAMTSGYHLKRGDRPNELDSPGGYHDGTFVSDYMFFNSGTLDECNGRNTVTPEFPEGTYAYFLTQQWPFIPRCFRGDPSRSFLKK